jgi:hypothetical protein
VPARTEERTREIDSDLGEFGNAAPQAIHFMQPCAFAIPATPVGVQYCNPGICLPGQSLPSALGGRQRDFKEPLSDPRQSDLPVATNKFAGCRRAGGASVKWSRERRLQGEGCAGQGVAEEADGRQDAGGGSRRVADRLWT